MKCPKCSTALNVGYIKEVEIDECQECKGIWFDYDELRQAKDKVDPDLNWMDFEIWKHKDRFKGGDAQVSCPKCDVKMFLLDYDNTGVEIDYCGKCYGIWLDKDEFDHIIEALLSELVNKPLGEYVKATLQEAKEIFTGPESFASEWKDFTTVLRLLKYRILSNNQELHKAIIGAQTVNPFK